MLALQPAPQAINNCLSEMNKCNPLERLSPKRAPNSRGAPSLPIEAPAATIATWTNACRRLT